jgi:D-alanine-D-alanine ligase
VLRHYAEKRDLGDGAKTYAIKPYRDAERAGAIEAAALELMQEFAPFDYGRFEGRLAEATGRFLFMEVNLNCNLWSRKTISMAARLAGWTHEQLIETILCESLRRNGLIDAAPGRALPRIGLRRPIPLEAMAV